MCVMEVIEQESLASILFSILFLKTFLESFFQLLTDFYFFIFLKTIIFDNFEEKSVKYFEKFCNKNYKMWLRHIIKQTLKRNFEKKSLILLRKNQKILTELVKNLGEKIFFRLLKVYCFFFTIFKVFLFFQGGMFGKLPNFSQCLKIFSNCP